MSTVINSLNELRGNGIATDKTIIDFASYKARVEADGGQIMDEDRTMDLFAFLATNNISTDNPIGGANFGLKVVNGSVYKIYSLDGNDWEATESDAGGNNHYPVLKDNDTYFSILSDFKSDGVSDRIRFFKQKYERIYINENKSSFIFWDSIKLKSGSTSASPVSFESDKYIHALLYRSMSADTYYSSYYYKNFNVNGGVTKSNSNVSTAGYVANKGVVTIYNVDAYNIKQIINGVETLKQNTLNNRILDVKEIPMKLTIGTTKGSNSYVPSVFSFTEIGAIINGTDAQALLVSSRLNGLY